MKMVTCYLKQMKEYFKYGNRAPDLSVFLFKIELRNTNAEFLVLYMNGNAKKKEISS